MLGKPQIDRTWTEEAAKKNDQEEDLSNSAVADFTLR